MKKFLLSAICMLFCIAVCSAQYPTLYLRGEINGWSAPSDYRFSVNADGVYSLYLDEFYGQFKVADDSWGSHIYGCLDEQNGGRTVTGTGSYEMLYLDGDNFHCDRLTNVTFKFSFIEGENLTLEVETGTTPPAGDDDDDYSGISGTLPVLHINVYTDDTHTTLNNEIISKDLNHKNYFSYAEYWLDMNDCQWLADLGGESVGSEESPLPLEIKGRGNWTLRGFAKKPFKLKLGKKQSLLGLSKSKHFALLAHADDYYGYMRNFVGFNLGQRIGLPWTPTQQPVEVIINGDYRGLYFLTESIRVEEKRINIEELADNETDPALISGGYLVELDNYDESNQISMAEKSCTDGHYLDLLRITWDTPEEYSDIQKRFVTDQFTAMNDAVGDNSDQLWSYLDLDDVARYYLVREIVADTESFHGSTYLFRDRGEGQKWHFSPLWDFGNAFSGNSDNFFYNIDPFGNTWIPSLRCNETFNDKVKATWVWFMQHGFDGIYDDIATYTDHLKSAAYADHKRWDGQPTPSDGQSVCDNSLMDEKKAAVISKLTDKTNWLKTQFGDYTNIADTEEPQRDTTPAAPLPDYVSGIENVATDAVNATVYPAEYFDLTGRRILNPEPNALIIERRGSNSRLIKF